MRKPSLLLGALAGLAMVATPAFAEVNLTAWINKDKSVYIDEYITVNKYVNIYSTTDITADKAAESSAILNQENNNNRACENCAEKTDSMSWSVLSNVGITSVNQASGNMNNQANDVSVAIDNPGLETDTKKGFADAQAHAEQVNGGFRGVVALETQESGLYLLGNTVDSINILYRAALLDNSVNFNSGITHVNQSPGNMNNQGNAVSLALALAPGVALSEADLGQENAFNKVFEANVYKTATMNSSVNGNVGIVGVNQSSGNMANQANIVAVGVAARF